MWICQFAALAAAFAPTPTSAQTPLGRPSETSAPSPAQAADPARAHRDRGSHARAPGPAGRRRPAPTGPVIPAGRENQIQGLLADVGVDRPLAGGVLFDQTRVQRDAVAYDLRTPAGGVVATVTLRHRSEAAPGDTLTRSFALRVTPPSALQAHGGVLRAALASIAAHDTAELFIVPETHTAHPPHLRPDWQWALAAIALALLALALIAWRLHRAAELTWRERVTFTFKPTHALPAALQVIIFAYWALYYRDLRLYLPGIALQIVFAYVVDAALDLATRRRWHASFSPLPVTLSTNLFVLFIYGQGYLTLLAIALALVSKRVIRRQGRHVLNPSAFGTAMVGLLTLFVPAFGYGDSAYQFALAPNMTELVLLLALVVQVRVPVVLVSASAVAGLYAVGFATGRISFSPFWAPVTLVIVLLATDPATSPRKPLGRVLYGFAVGVFMRACGATLEHVFDHDFYGKVLGVLLANCFVPWFDGLAARARWSPAWLEPRFNRVHVALWFGLMAWAVGGMDHKARDFTACTGCQAAHHDNRTRFVRFAPDRRVRCADNPVSCGGFSFAAEVQCWRRAGGPDACGGGRPEARADAPAPLPYGMAER